MKRIENLMTNLREAFVIKSEIQGSEGKITTYNPRFLGKQFYFSISETKWHNGEKYKRVPIWFSRDKESRGLYIWKLAIFYDNKNQQSLNV